jgi:hypothetical protein
MHQCRENSVPPRQKSKQGRRRQKSKNGKEIQKSKITRANGEKTKTEKAKSDTSKQE